MIIGLFGTLGTGKTLTLTKIASEQFLKGRIIYSNYKLNFPYKLIPTWESLIDIKFKPEHKYCLVLDEIALWLDSRNHSAKKNQVIASFLLDSRRKKFNIIWSEQILKQVDNRLRDITDLWASPECSDSFILPDGEIGYKICTVTYVLRDGTYIKTDKFYTSEIHKLYNSFENLDYLKNKKDKNYILDTSKPLSERIIKDSLLIANKEYIEHKIKDAENKAIKKLKGL